MAMEDIDAKEKYPVCNEQFKKWRCGKKSSKSFKTF